MTFEPQSLRDLEAFWIANKGTSLGIAGDGDHQNKGVSYHLGKSALKPGAYSAQLPRDVAGLSEAASAIDLGKLNVSLKALQEFSVWFVRQCIAGLVPDVREVIYTPDGKLPIHRYSAPDNTIYTGAGNGDNSHLTHTHISYYRDSEGRDKIAAFAPYFGGDMAGLATTNPRSGPAKVQPKPGAGRKGIRVRDSAIIDISGLPGKDSGAMVDITTVTVEGFFFSGPAHLIGLDTVACMVQDMDDVSPPPVVPPVQPADCTTAIADDRSKAYPAIAPDGRVVVEWRP